MHCETKENSDGELKSDLRLVSNAQSIGLYCGGRSLAGTNQNHPLPLCSVLAQVALWRWRAWHEHVLNT